ncbi:MAG: DUF2878 domain-containing protein [Gammaproteobacteria bacterium]|nr:DUF2878 domain-containing protein [Gammaproteobacteria bacterium]
MFKIILNLLVFQVGWLVCVLGGNIYALIYTSLAMAFHHGFVLVRTSEWSVVALVTATGCLWDAFMAFSGVIKYTNTDLIGLPIWLICLWLLFATTFHHSLRWLANHLWLAAVLAAVFGPFSYWAGSQLSSADISLPIINSLLIIAAGWSLLFPAGIYIAGKSRPLT